MRSLAVTLLLAILAVSYALANPSTVNAQTTIECGDVIEAEFTDGGQSHTYEIQLEEDTNFSMIIEEYDDYSDLYFYMYLYDPRGRRIEDDGDGTLIIVETDPLSASGNYVIEIVNDGSASSGSYRLHIGCVTPDNEIISNTRFVNGVVCGNIVASEFLKGGELSIYYIYLNSDDILSLSVEEVGSYSDLYLYVELYLPNGRLIEDDGDGEVINFVTGSLPDTGLYMFIVMNDGSAESGDYEVSIGCNQDGKQIQPGDVPFEEDED